MLSVGVCFGHTRRLLSTLHRDSGEKRNKNPFGSKQNQLVI